MKKSTLLKRVSNANHKTSLMMLFYKEKGLSLLAITYFHKKTPSWMFDRLFNTPLFSVIRNSFTCEMTFSR